MAIEELTLQSVLHFGKYRGRTLAWVIGYDAEYVQWALDEIDGFEIDEEGWAELETALADTLEEGELADSWRGGWPGDYGDR